MIVLVIVLTRGHRRYTLEARAPVFGESLPLCVESPSMYDHENEYDDRLMPEDENDDEDEYD